MRKIETEKRAGRPRLGISACLLGDRVRYDGGHKRDPVLVRTLGRLVEWVPICPEVAVGLGVPRPPIRLEGSPHRPRLVMTGAGSDLTGRMRRFAEAQAEALDRLGLDGYVFKSRSPSCGLFGVPVHADHSTRRGTGRGLYAAVLLRRLPSLAAVDEDRLHDPAIRRRFLARVFAAAARRRRGSLPGAPAPARPLTRSPGRGRGRARRRSRPI